MYEHIDIEKIYALTRLEFMMSEFARENKLSLWKKTQYGRFDEHEFVFTSQPDSFRFGAWKFIINLGEWNGNVSETIVKITTHVLTTEPIKYTQDDLWIPYFD